MQTAGTIFILLGMLLAFLAQIAGAVLVFRFDILKGILSVIVPGYFLSALRQAGIYWRFLGVWGLGIMGMVIGTILLS
jgi:hypothetical protein